MVYQERVREREEKKLLVLLVVDLEENLIQ